MVGYSHLIKVLRKGSAPWGCRVHLLGVALCVCLGGCSGDQGNEADPEQQVEDVWSDDTQVLFYDDTLIPAAGDSFILEVQGETVDASTSTERIDAQPNPLMDTTAVEETFAFDLLDDAAPPRPSQDVVFEDVAIGPSSDADVMEEVAEEGDAFEESLCFNHLQGLGTHNSYHKAPFLPIPHWAYDHLPLDEQLQIQGVRQFELDVYYDGNGFDVYHVIVVDQETTCDTLTDCLNTMKDWSDTHLVHHPLHMLLEIKDTYDAGQANEILEHLESQILSVWPMERIITPDLVRGDAASLNDAMATHGWPTLESTRGMIMFVLHEDGDWREAYTAGGTTAAGCLLFPDAMGDLSLPYAAHHTMNDPEGGLEAIQQVVNAGHLVRTRADSDGAEAFAHDKTRFEKALESGAHFISTDYPAPNDSLGYELAIPEGNPSRCNPLTAPEQCVPEAIENLDDLVPSP